MPHVLGQECAPSACYSRRTVVFSQQFGYTLAQFILCMQHHAVDLLANKLVGDSSGNEA